MAVTISTEDLSDAVQAALEEYGDLAKEVTRDTVRKVAKTCRQEIRAASPYRTGRYSKGWRVKETASPNGDVTETVYNASAPGLTHLLEDGHATVNGGRVAGKAHIAPAEQRAEANLLEGLERELSL